MRVRLASLSSTLASCLLVATALGACGGGDDGNPGDTTDAAVDSPPGEVGTFTATWGPKVIPAGTEETECVQFRIDNAGPIKVHEIHYTLGLAYYYLDQCDKSYPLYDVVLQMDPEDPNAREGCRSGQEREKEYSH